MSCGPSQFWAGSREGPFQQHLELRSCTRQEWPAAASCAWRSRADAGRSPEVCLALRGTYLKRLFFGAAQSCFLSIKRLAEPGSPVLQQKSVILSHSCFLGGGVLASEASVTSYGTGTYRGPEAKEVKGMCEGQWGQSSRGERTAGRGQATQSHQK